MEFVQIFTIGDRAKNYYILKSIMIEAEREFSLSYMAEAAESLPRTERFKNSVV